MLRFIAVHPVVFTEEQLAPLAREKLPVDVTWHSTFCGFADNRSFCHWQAPSKEVLVELFAKYEIPCETIHEVRLFDPLIGELEPEPEKVAQPV
jgi:Nickel responsive protein SCO4226-like